jgi:glutamate racemase
MDNRPIGVFDSGLGGLTAVRELMAQLPAEDIIYFGDTSRVPYGGRSRETIVKYARQDIHFLLQSDIKAIVIACNTADASARSVLQPEFDLPIFGVVEPSAQLAAQTTKNGKIGLIGTQATIASGLYERIIRAARPDAEIMARACPLFVPLVENGRILPGDVVIETVAAEYLQPLRDWGCDTLVLGCTHYPLLTEVIGAYMGSGVTLINSGAAAAQLVRERLGAQDALADPARQGTCRYYVSDSPTGFAGTASLFLQREIRDDVTQINIDQY